MDGTLRILMEGLIDYAGLFPPASLPMDAAARNHADYLAGPGAPWLGRFVVPAARLGELAGSLEGLAAGGAAAPGAPRGGRGDAGNSQGTWRISALAGEDPGADLAAVEAFNRASAGRPGPRALVDSFEARAARPEDAGRAAGYAPRGLAVYAEIPLAEEPGPFLAALARAGVRAKIRTGGTLPETIPGPARVARFLAACARARIPFKATAGLHHPVRSEQPLTYAPDSPRAVMHGFLNVFLAAAFAAQGVEEAALAALLAEEDAGSFAFAGGTARWRGYSLGAADLRAARRDFALAFGSCSFEEPLQDLQRIGLL